MNLIELQETIIKKASGIKIDTRELHSFLEYLESNKLLEKGKPDFFKKGNLIFTRTLNGGLFSHRDKDIHDLSF